jgi:hypothetical protein
MGAFGLGLGFVVSSAGLADWGEVHRMFTLGIPSGGPRLADLHLLVAFATAVAVAMAGFHLLARRDEIPVKRVRPGTIPGALLFGVGWAPARPRRWSSWARGRSRRWPRWAACWGAPGCTIACASGSAGRATPASTDSGHL